MKLKKLNYSAINIQNTTSCCARLIYKTEEKLLLPIEINENEHMPEISYFPNWNLNQIITFLLLFHVGLDGYRQHKQSEFKNM
jgi:hypothetical protein